MALNKYNSFFSYSDDDYNLLSKDQKLGIIDGILKELEDSKTYNKIHKNLKRQNITRTRYDSDNNTIVHPNFTNPTVTLASVKEANAIKELEQDTEKEYEAIVKDRNLKIKQMNALKQSIKDGDEVAFSKFKEKKYGYPTLTAEDWDAMDKEFGISTGKDVTVLPEDNKAKANEQSPEQNSNKTSESSKATSSASNPTKPSTETSGATKSASFNQSFYDKLQGTGKTVYENLGDKKDGNGKLVRKEMEGVRRWQEKYRNAGLYKGPLDGIWGKGTQAAYNKWKEMKNKPANEAQKSSTTPTTTSTSTTPVANEKKEGVKVSTAPFDFMKAVDEDYKKRNQNILTHDKEKEIERELELTRNARGGDINSMMELAEIDRQKKKKLKEKESKQKQAIAEHEKFLKENGIIPSL